jgi:hypothetical protein
MSKQFDKIKLRRTRGKCMVEQLNKEKDMKTVYELAKTTLKGWKIEKLCNTVYATYSGDVLSASDFVALSIENDVQYGYVLRFICRLTKSISVSYDKSVQTIEILGNMLENINDLVPCYFNDGLNEILSNALREYLSVFERAIG